MTDVVVHTELKKAEKLISDLSQALAVVRSELGAARQEISDVRNVAAGSVIKSVQRGFIQIASRNKTASITVSSVNPNKAELRFLGKEVGNESIAFRYEVCLILENSTTVKASRSEVGQSDTEIKVSFELTEYY